MTHLLGQTKSEEFRNGLEEWINQTSSDSDENRAKAIRRILECQQTNTTSLDLEGFQLTSLPPQLVRFGTFPHPQDKLNSQK